MPFNNLLVRSISGFSWSRTLTYFIVLIAFSSLVGSVKQFIVSNTYYSVKNSLDSWNVAPSSASVNEVEIALAKIEEVIVRAPNNALYHQLQGQLYEWLHYSTSLTNNVNDISNANNDAPILHRAALSYKESLKLRPNWSGGWIGLASVKWKLGELDSEFYEHLNKAVSVGPQDAIVHRFIVEFGLTMYMNRSVHYAKISKRLKHNLALGLINPLSRNFILEFIRKNNLNEPVCRWLGPSSYAVSTVFLDCK